MARGKYSRKIRRKGVGSHRRGIKEKKGRYNRTDIKIEIWRI